MTTKFPPQEIGGQFGSALRVEALARPAEQPSGLAGRLGVTQVVDLSLLRLPLAISVILASRATADFLMSYRPDLSVITIDPYMNLSWSTIH
jgi:hypothetical protein